MIRVHVEFISFDELSLERSWIKGGQIVQTGGTTLGILADPGDLEESASHHDSHDVAKTCSGFNRSRELEKTPSIPSERASKNWIRVEFISFYELGVEIRRPKSGVSELS